MLNHLLIMRHAKSSWEFEDLSDHQRPLNKRGERSADVIAQTLTTQGLAPDMIWCSDAERTSQTAKRLIRLIPGRQTVFYNPALYMASQGQILQICEQAGEPDDTDRLMILAHNPGMAHLFEYFTKRTHNYPTAACAVFSRRNSGAHWLSSEAWQFRQLLLPRDLLRET